MKLLLVVLVISIPVFGRHNPDFNQELAADLKSEISKDNEKFKKVPVRGPASVTPVEKVEFEGPEKIEKNVKQLGHRSW
jgi:hypothetical protein